MKSKFQTILTLLIIVEFVPKISKHGAGILGWVFQNEVRWISDKDD